MSVNIRVQDLDLLPVPRADNRRLEVVTDGLPLHGAQLVVDSASRRSSQEAMCRTG